MCAAHVYSSSVLHIAAELLTREEYQWKTVHFISLSCQSAQLLLLLLLEQVILCTQIAQNINNDDATTYVYRRVLRKLFCSENNNKKIVSNISFSVQRFNGYTDRPYTESIVRAEILPMLCIRDMPYGTTYATPGHLHMVYVRPLVRVCVCVSIFIHKNLDVICTKTTTTKCCLRYSLRRIICALHGDSKSTSVDYTHTRTHTHGRTLYLMGRIGRVEKWQKREAKKIKWSITNAFSYEEGNNSNNKRVTFRSFLFRHCVVYFALVRRCCFTIFLLLFCIKEDFHAPFDRWWLFTCFFHFFFFLFFLLNLLRENGEKGIDGSHGPKRKRLLCAAPNASMRPIAIETSCIDFAIS